MRTARSITKQANTALATAVLVILLGAGPTLNMFDDPGGSGMALARGGGGGGGARGGGGGRASQMSSRVDRQPRASSARQGSIQRANTQPARSVSRPATAGTRQGSAGAGTSQQRPASRETALTRDTTAKTRQTGQTQNRSEWNKKLQTQDRSKPDARTDRQTTRADGAGQRRAEAPSREERSKNVDDRRKEYSDNRDEIRNERKQSMDDWQKSRQDYLDSAREDRQDFAEDMMKHREDMWEDMYDDHHYWGDWDDDDNNNDEWLWGIVGGLAGYMIGAAVNSPPAGTVTVPAGGTNYQYYGGAFYQPAPSGQGYVTAPAPIGAEVEAPPLDCTIVFGPNPADPGYCFFQGAFFLYDEKSDSYLVAEPPRGTQVPYLPDGYTEETVNGVEYYKLGAIYYRPYLAGDEEIFVVSKI
jgi:hypothetical protein